jgi:hypothetical protein
MRQGIEAMEVWVFDSYREEESSDRGGLASSR